MISFPRRNDSVSIVCNMCSGECRKRKGLVDEGFYSPDSKQLITEEIVAARLGSLYLDQQSPCDANTDVVQDSGDVPMKNSV